MTRLEALEIFEQLQASDPERLPVPPEARHVMQTPISLASVASLTGWLDDLAPDDLPGLIAAAEHGLDLVSADVFSYDDWELELADLARAKVRAMDARY